MPTFLVQNKHSAGECEDLEREWEERAGTPLRDAEFICTCPTGEHGGYWLFEAASTDEVLASMPRRLRETSTVQPVEIVSHRDI